MSSRARRRVPHLVLSHDEHCVSRGPSASRPAGRGFDYCVGEQGRVVFGADLLRTGTATLKKYIKLGEPRVTAHVVTTQVSHLAKM